jgi:hypothetical protein
MIDLFEVAKKIMDNRTFEGDSNIYETAMKEWENHISTYHSVDDLIKIIKYDLEHLRLPFNNCTDIFNRLSDLGHRTPYVLRWYAFIISFYCDPGEKYKANKLKDEADKLENSGN